MVRVREWRLEMADDVAELRWWGDVLIRPRSEFESRRAVSAAVGLRRCRPRLKTARGGEMRLDTCRASPQVVAAGGMASSGAREPVEDPASKVLITSSVADQ